MAGVTFTHLKEVLYNLVTETKCEIFHAEVKIEAVKQLISASPMPKPTY